MKKLILLLSFLLVIAGLPALAGNVPTISKEELKARLNSGTLVLLDVRSGRDWSSSEFKITGAIRAPGSEIAEWSKNYAKDQTLVLYCA
jgi:rhodanese-related sulfurtransferase